MSTAYEPHQAFHRGTAPISARLTPKQTEELSQLQSDPSLVERLAELAEKANDGELTPVEQAEYEAPSRPTTFLPYCRQKPVFVWQTEGLKP